MADFRSAAVWSVGTGLHDQSRLAWSADGGLLSTQWESSTTWYPPTIDPASGRAMQVWWAVDRRDHATGSGPTPPGARDGAASDSRVKIETTHGVLATIGNLGYVDVRTRGPGVSMRSPCQTACDS
ncbi:MAG: hypothetical protein IPM29_04880 [Planctomycetes bacterium]|nr:hypothetical protein [Planctomycetota bacterium]